MAGPKADDVKWWLRKFSQDYNHTGDSNPDEPLLLNVLHTQVIPHVDATRQKKIQQQLDQVLHTVDAARRENSLSQKRRDLEQIFDGTWDLRQSLDKFL